MGKQVFISYRRHRSNDVAVRIAKYLRRILPDEFVFLDTASIPSGHDFHLVLRNAINGSDIVLVLIEPGWSELRDASQTLRLHDPGDYVRMEVQWAIEGGKIVVPILLDGEPMPLAQQLPPEILTLCTKQALSANSRSVEASIDRLILEQKIGVVDYNVLVDLLRQYGQIAEWEPNLRHKADQVKQYCNLRPYEKLAGLLDLTLTGNGKHFLAFSTAGFYHRSVGPTINGSFRALCRISKVTLDEKRSTVFIDDEGWTLLGTMEDEAYALIRRIMTLCGDS